MISKCGFTEPHYREIISAFLDRGYRFKSFRQFAAGEDRQVILRHDVDVALEDAQRMAMWDADLGVTSVFHMLLTAETYNLASAHGADVLAKIRSFGHWVGLHVDPIALRKSGSDGTALRQALCELFRLARLLLGPLDSHSLHRPATYGELDCLGDGRLQIDLPPSADEFRKRMLYRSDSRRHWRQGCICHEIEKLHGRSIHLSLHPIWWTCEERTRDQILQALLDRSRVAMDRYLDSNLSFYHSHRA